MRTLLRRLGQGAVTMLIVATVTFVLVHLAPGDPFTRALDSGRVTPEIRAQLRAAYGLDAGLGTQYVRWLAALLHGELGWSISNGMPVSHAIAAALPATLWLMGTALVVAFTLGIALGAVQARHRDTLLDRAIGTLALIGAALPDFWLAIVLLLSGAYWLRLFPVGGNADLLLPLGASTSTVVLDRLRHLVLPASTLVILFTATVARQQRAALLDRLGADWVRTARAKGVPPRRVFLRHALRNALGPIATLAGLALPALVGGEVFVEAVFAWPGMGQLAASAIATRDYPLVIGCTLTGALMVVLGTVLADTLRARLEPQGADHRDATTAS